jgi:hypothetical protein
MGMGKVHKLLPKLVLMLLPVLTTACGQISMLGQSRQRVADVSALSTLYVPESDTSGSCRYEDVIVPDNDTWLDGSGYYNVCPSSAEPGTVTVYGSAPEAKQFCVFPAQVADGGAIYPRITVLGAPMMMCSNKNPGGQVFSFEQTRYNAAFIVPYQDRAQMQLCLATGNYHQCPKSFSYGQFRE